MTNEEFERAARTYGDMIYRVARHALKNPSDAEDATQNVLLRLLRAGDFDGEEHLKHWLLRVAVNESRRLLRSPWRQRVVPLEEWRETPSLPDETREVWDAVMALERKYRLAVYLYYYEECSVKEVAAALNAKESTVQTWLQRARDKLRDALTAQEKEGPPCVRQKTIP